MQLWLWGGAAMCWNISSRLHLSVFFPRLQMLSNAQVPLQGANLFSAPRKPMHFNNCAYYAVSSFHVTLCLKSINFIRLHSNWLTAASIALGKPQTQQEVMHIMTVISCRPLTHFAERCWSSSCPLLLNTKQYTARCLMP